MKGEMEMKKKLRTALLLTLIGSIGLANTVFGSGATVPGSTLNFNSDAADTVAEGTNVSSQGSGIAFGTTGNISAVNGIPAVNATEYVRLTDNRGTNAGWRAKVSATDLTATDLDDKSSASNLTDTVTVTIPINSILTAATSSLTGLNGSNITGVTVASSSTAVTNSGVDVMNAAAASGAGDYRAAVGYILSLPKYLPTGSTVTPSALIDSSFDTATVTNLGLFAGTYSTTVTYAISAAP